MEQEYLNGKEHDDYINDISGIASDLIAKVLSVADKHNVDRDNAMQHFSQLLSAMVEISSFANFEGVNQCQNQL